MAGEAIAGRLVGSDADDFGADAEVTIFDPQRQWKLEASRSSSKSHNTPFDGWTLKGKVTRTIVGGRSVWEETE